LGAQTHKRQTTHQQYRPRLQVKREETALTSRLDCRIALQLRRIQREDSALRPGNLLRSVTVQHRRTRRDSLGIARTGQKSDSIRVLDGPANVRTGCSGLVGHRLDSWCSGCYPRSHARYGRTRRGNENRCWTPGSKAAPVGLHALAAQKAFTFFRGAEIFQNPRTGERWTGDKCIRQGIWAPGLRKSGVRYRKPYQTRHTYASMMLMAGEHVMWVAKQMGTRIGRLRRKRYSRWITSDMPDAGFKAVKLWSASGQHDSVSDSEESGEGGFEPSPDSTVL
jgi:hypothetical protein